MLRLTVTVFVLFTCVLTFSCAGFREPTDEHIRREFLARHPNANIIKYTKTFEEVAVAVYEVEFKKDSEEVLKQRIMLHQCMNFDWKADYKQCDK